MKGNIQGALRKEGKMGMDSLNGIMVLSIEGTIIWEFEKGKGSISTEKVPAYRRAFGRMGS